MLDFIGAALFLYTLFDRRRGCATLLLELNRGRGIV